MHMHNYWAGGERCQGTGSGVQLTVLVSIDVIDPRIIRNIERICRPRWRQKECPYIRIDDIANLKNGSCVVLCVFLVTKESSWSIWPEVIDKRTTKKDRRFSKTKRYSIGSIQADFHKYILFYYLWEWPAISTHVCGWLRPMVLLFFLSASPIITNAVCSYDIHELFSNISHQDTCRLPTTKPAPVTDRRLKKTYQWRCFPKRHVLEVGWI